VVVVGHGAGRRVALLREALARLGLPPARVVSYPDLLVGRVALPDVVQAGSIVRIESPDKDLEGERALLAAGADEPDPDGPDADGYDRLTREQVAALQPERGRILPTRQWYLGLCRVLRLIEEQLAACPPHRPMNAPADVATMFDKRRCHALLQRHGVAVPRCLGLVRSYAELMARMHDEHWRRVFVKIAHGSSASGVVALQTNGRQLHATTTVQLTRDAGALRLYNSRRLRVYRDPDEVALLIDTLCRHRVHVEQWLPKASVGDRAFDLRVVVIAGQVRHVVARFSRGPMTNLHLLNERGGLDTVLPRIGADAWTRARDACEAVMAACFPHSLHAGIDLMFTPDYRRHAVLEVNAFGDLLPGALSDGQDTYTAEVVALLDDRVTPGAARQGGGTATKVAWQGTDTEVSSKTLSLCEMASPITPYHNAIPSSDFSRRHVPLPRALGQGLPVQGTATQS